MRVPPRYLPVCACASCYRTWIAIDLATELPGFPRTMDKLYHERFHFEFLMPMAYQQDRFVLPATFKLEGLQNFTFGGATSQGLDWSARTEGRMRIQGTPFHPSPAVWGGTITAAGMGMGFEATIVDPTIKHDATGAGIVLHEVALKIIMSIPSVTFTDVTLHASKAYCGSNTWNICGGSRRSPPPSRARPAQQCGLCCEGRRMHTPVAQCGPVALLPQNARASAAGPLLACTPAAMLAAPARVRETVP